MQIDEAVRIVMDYVSAWTDQKLAEVAAFCEDGKMHFYNPCCCLIGVSSSINLHRDFRTCGGIHYTKLRVGNPEANCVENAYQILGKETDGHGGYGQPTRDQRFLAILREVMGERTSATARAEVEKEIVYADQ